MANLNPEENRLYASPDDLHALHWEKLAARDRDEAARASGAAWDGKRFTLPFLGDALWITPDARRVRFVQGSPRRAGYQHALVAVTYLYASLEADPSGTWAAFRELPGGEAFFRGPHSLNTPFLETVFGDDPSRLDAAGKAMGGRTVDGGDAAVELPVLPRIPMRALVWGKGEFGASAQMLIDSRAHLHLPLDVIWALSNIVIAQLVRGAA